MWGTLALLTSFNKNIPPFQLMSMTFSVAFLVGLLVFLKSRENLSCFKQPLSVWASGIFGLFGYHFFYFMALKNAPPIEASLIAYLWPIFIVIFSSFLPGERLRWFHLFGVIIGFFGVVLIILKGDTFDFKQEYALGYLLAFICALIWSLYSVISRKNHNVPSILICAYCGVTAILSLICHQFFEETIIPSFIEWECILLLGLGPIGCAFFAWDYGVKKGNIKLLGTLSYAAPLLSSMLLICFGLAAPTFNIIISCIFIVGGAAITAFDTIQKLTIKDVNK